MPWPRRVDEDRAAVEAHGEIAGDRSDGFMELQRYARGVDGLRALRAGLWGEPDGHARLKSDVGEGFAEQRPSDTQECYARDGQRCISTLTRNTRGLRRVPGDEMTERLQGRYVDHIFATYGPMGARCFGIGRIRMRGPCSASVAQDRAALSRQTPLPGEAGASVDAWPPGGGMARADHQSRLDHRHPSRATTKVRHVSTKHCLG